ncbi:PAS domain S-box-containing protein [Paucimonas lemoignei]|uniref:PAS domain S-box-containing protein n=1 Tax=Paucimonas lemoignei TaxID=29443 RepID=A0A4R3HU99_PAULE|nr:PAS domain S-box protein [Paucimonas lemoignei]TCS36063.1 PAS domain S-box-containing protein [Paucimonas lemoignei]
MPAATAAWTAQQLLVIFTALPFAKSFMSPPIPQSTAEMQAELHRLREENDMLKSLVRDAPVAFVALDLERRVKLWNHAAERIFGWREEEVIGKPLPHVPAAGEESSRELHKRVVAGNSLRDIEIERITKAGQELRLSLSTSPLRDIANNIIGQVGVYDDPDEGAAPEIPFRGLVEQSLVGLYIIQDRMFQYVNPRWAEMFGRTQEEMAPRLVADFIAPEDRGTVEANLDRRISGKISSIFYHFKGLHKDGRLVDVEVQGTRFQYRGRPAVIGVGIDVTEARLREQEIARSQERLRELSQHLLTVREEQRSKIARELHDVLGGTLTALKMDIGWLKKNTTETRLAARAETMMELVRDAIDTVRKISAELRPGVLDNLGLFDAIEWEAERFRARMGIECKLALQSLPVEIEDAAATAIFRIFQESLTNIARHAQATRVEIAAGHVDGTLLLSVQDNGQGFDMKAAGDSKSYGLIGMAERARQFGATLDIASEPGQGARVLLRYPLAVKVEGK